MTLKSRQSPLSSPYHQTKTTQKQIVFGTRRPPTFLVHLGFHDHSPNIMGFLQCFLSWWRLFYKAAILGVGRHVDHIWRDHHHVSFWDLMLCPLSPSFLPPPSTFFAQILKPRWLGWDLQPKYVTEVSLHPKLCIFTVGGLETIAPH